MTDEDLARWQRYGALVWEVYARLRPSEVLQGGMTEKQRYDWARRALRFGDMVARLTLKSPSGGWGAEP